MYRFIKYFGPIEIFMIVFCIAVFIYGFVYVYRKVKCGRNDKGTRNILCLLIVAIIIYTIALKFRYDQTDMYYEAIAFENGGNYIEAMETYTKISGFSDVDERMEDIMDEYNYCIAIQYFQNEEYTLAANYFANCVLFRDSYNLLGICLEYVKGGDV